MTTVMEHFEAEYEALFREYSDAATLDSREAALQRLDEFVLAFIVQQRRGRCAGLATVQ